MIYTLIQHALRMARQYAYRDVDRKEREIREDFAALSSAFAARLEALGSALAIFEDRLQLLAGERLQKSSSWNAKLMVLADVAAISLRMVRMLRSSWDCSMAAKAA